MKIILSRKGFDSSAGGVASPIFPDGTLLSLPIPDQKGAVSYADLCWGEYQLGPLVETLTLGRINRQQRAHLDPDLYPAICTRPPAWRPLFGQDGAAQSHLANQGVGVSDLFLFFGWFRAVELARGHYRFVKNAPDLHLLYGWLQVGAVLSGAQIATAPPLWAATHPHCIGGRGTRNTLYVACDRLTVDGHITTFLGAGYFSRYRDDRCLTAPGRLRTHWRLPRWFYPQEGKPPLSYHTDRTRWSCDDAYAYLQSAMRGQEFVLDTRHYPAAATWVNALLSVTVQPDNYNELGEERIGGSRA